jgi:hypothetical protein
VCYLCILCGQLMSNKKSVEVNEKCSQIHIVVVHDDTPLSCTQLIIGCWRFYVFLVDKGHTRLFRINTFMLTRWKIRCCRFLERKIVSALDTKCFCLDTEVFMHLLYCIATISIHCYSGCSCFVLERFGVWSMRVAILTEVLCNLSSTVLALNLEIGHEFISSWHCHRRIYQHEYWVLNCRSKQKIL